MPINFGNNTNNDQDLTPEEENEENIIGDKTISKDGTLNFENEKVDIIGEGPDKRVEDTINEEVSIDNTEQETTAQKNTGPLNFGAKTEEEILRNTESPNIQIKINESGASEVINSTSSSINDIFEFSPLSRVAPAYTLDPVIPGVPTQTILDQVSQRCTERILDELDNIDPFLRLQRLLDIAQQLCQNGLFDQLRSVIDKIQQAKRDLVYEAINTITDPLQRIAKLHDMLVDAINTGAQDLVNEILGILQNERFNALLEALDRLDPRRAIDLLNSEIRRLTDLRQFEAVRDLLAAVQNIQDQFREFEQLTTNLFDQINNFLDQPERFLDELQQQIYDALDLNNYETIQDLLSAYDSFKDTIDQILSQLDPNRLVELANEALENLDLGRYNRILQELANQLCSEEFGVLPTLPEF